MPLGLKRLIKHFSAIAVYYSGLFRLVLHWRKYSGRDSGYIILMYHRVVDPEDPTNRYTQAGMSVTHETFKKQVAFLADKYRILPLRELVTELGSGRPPSPGTVVITFDDGWQDNYRFGLPVLVNYRAPATIFLATDFIESNELFWFLKVGVALAESTEPASVVAAVVAAASAMNGSSGVTGGAAAQDSPDGIYGLDDVLEFMKRLDADQCERIADDLLTATGMPSETWQKRRWILSWEEIHEMRDQGIEFGSHGRSHRILTNLSADEARQELVESKEILERELGLAVSLFAYPNGAWDAAVLELVKRAGYTAAIATSLYPSGRAAPDLFALGRVGIHEGVSQGCTGKFSRALFACAIHKVFPFR